MASPETSAEVDVSRARKIRGDVSDEVELESELTPEPDETTLRPECPGRNAALSPDRTLIRRQRAPNVYSPYTIVSYLA